MNKEIIQDFVNKATSNNTKLTPFCVVKNIASYSDPSEYILEGKMILTGVSYGAGSAVFDISDKNVNLFITGISGAVLANQQNLLIFCDRIKIQPNTQHHIVTISGYKYE